jgi:hypothetical protein
MSEKPKTKSEIIEQMWGIIPLRITLSHRAIPYIEEAMQLYADQEAMAFANWLSNTVIAGRTMHQLFNDYKQEEER